MRLQGLVWALISTMVVSAADGLLCDSRPQDHQTMECCREDGNRLDAAEMDCCRPDRAENVPAERLATTRNQTTLMHVATLAPTISQLWTETERHRALVPLLRGFPDVHPHLSQAAPLLI